MTFEVFYPKPFHFTPVPNKKTNLRAFPTLGSKFRPFVEGVHKNIVLMSYPRVHLAVMLTHWGGVAFPSVYDVLPQSKAFLLPKVAFPGCPLAQLP